jgi:streptomycin 6-kinase
MIEVPERLHWWRETPAGAEWLASLPRLAEECAEQWLLRLAKPYRGGNVSLTVPAERADGTLAVLKINFPEEETDHEADALAHWRGEGAVRLLEADRNRNALLIERAVPGTSLWEIENDEEATLVAASVLRRIWRHPPPESHPFRLLADEAEQWMAQLGLDWDQLGRPFEREIVDAGVAAARELSRSQPDLVVCHQDFQGSNVLRAQRERWLAIDPKPIVGERAFDVASLLRDRRWMLRRPGSATRIQRRLDLLASELDLDRERMRGWGIVHTLYWGVGPRKVEADMIECASLLLGTAVNR